jgi:hypothetical protein
MKRGHIILIAGSIFLIMGIGISVTSVIGPFLYESTKVINSTVKPGQSINISRHVAVNAEATTAQPSLALSIATKQQQQQQQQQRQSNDNVLLREQIKDPHGRIVTNDEFKNQFFITTQPQSSGNYTVTITNLGNQLVTVYALFGQVPFVNEKNQIQLGPAIMILGGGIAIIVGIIVLISGGVILVMDSKRIRRKENPK